MKISIQINKFNKMSIYSHLLSRWIVTSLCFLILAILSGGFFCEAAASDGTKSGVPVLLYHDLRAYGTEESPDTVISIKKFEEQMKYLYENGFTTISMDDLVSFMKGGSVAEKSIVLTFDDGWKNVIDVIPILDKYNFKASFYIFPGSGIGGPYMEWTDILKLSQNPNFQIGAHSMTHPMKDDNYLVTWANGQTPGRGIDDVVYEITKSKRILETMLKREVRYFAWPRGSYNEKLISIAKEAGYKALLTVEDGGNTQGSDIYKIKRIVIDGACDVAKFQQTLRDYKHHVCTVMEGASASRIDWISKHVDEIAQLKGVEPALVKAIIKVESNYDPAAVSKKGAIGIMQILPDSSSEKNEDNLFDPVKNIEIGVDHLKKLLDKFNDDLPLALAAYNAGEGAVSEYNGVPPYQETRTYIDKVIDFYRKYKEEGSTTIGKFLDHPSVFELYVNQKTFPEINLDLKQFGYDLFVGVLRITVWGKWEGQWNVVVDRDGNINLPKIGILGVSGLSFQELREVLHKEFSKYYTGFHMNVSMGALRTIHIYVVGNGRQPGAYTVSSLTGLINALFEAGGPSKTGTMRDIQLKRNGETIVHLDFYDFLLKGDKTQDVRLMPDDVIFIPPVGELVGVAGNVNNPAIYELRDETTITNLIEMAGGTTASGYLQRVQVERVFENEVKIIVDANLKEMKKEDDLVLQDGDIVKIFPIMDKIINAVNVKGNVTRPGQYQWHEGMRVSDIVKDPDKNLLPETYFEHALIERHIPPDYHQEVIFFHLGRALFAKSKDEDILLQPYDTLTIYSKWDFFEKPQVQVSGAVNTPGKYELRPNMKVADLINLAGGPKRYALLGEAELTRIHITAAGPKIERFVIDLEKALAGAPESNIPLLEDDHLAVRTVPEWRIYQKTTISGEVRFPGTYTIKKGERLSSLIERAGGFTENAYLKGAVFTRERTRQLQQERLDEMVERLDRELLGIGSAEIATATTSEDAKIRESEIKMKRDFIAKLKAIKAKGRMAIKIDQPKRLKNTPYDIELEEGDNLFVPVNPHSVQVIGSVYNQTVFIYEEDKGVSDYLEMAGGYTENADKKRIYVLKANGTAIKGNSQNLDSGDTIVAPEKVTRIAWLRETKDIMQILYQIAVTAGVLIVVF
jgi:protein involved in polysaccharide export with SLBB domain/peptidoglycan/xylan/chitin deacetylase (PgdA/CDA1 family)